MAENIHTSLSINFIGNYFSNFKSTASGIGGPGSFQGSSSYPLFFWWPLIHGNKGDVPNISTMELHILVKRSQAESVDIEL